MSRTRASRERTDPPKSRPASFGKTRGRPERRVLVTGGAGFVGTNLAWKLADEGCEVVIFDNLSRAGVELNLQRLRAKYDQCIRFIRGDVRDSQAVRRAVESCDAVFHFAAQVAVTTSLRDPEADFAINAQGTLNVLEACRRLASPPPLLFTSTNKVYGDLQHLSLVLDGNRYVPTDGAIAAAGVHESCSLDFRSPYGCSKGTADQYVLDYARCWDLPAVVFRMSCIYGPHQCGTEDQGWVAHFARQVIDGEPITVFGDGHQVRDLLFVDDLTEAMTAAVDQINAVRGQAFNIGGGPANAVSVREVIDTLGRLHGRPVPVGKADWRQGDQRYYVSDIRRVERALGWTPTVTVERGVRRLYQWLHSDARQAAAAVG